MKITIERTEVEIITGHPVFIDKHEFTTADGAKKFLSERINALTDAHFEEIFSNPTTNLRWREMINRGGVAAFSGDVEYDITVDTRTC